MILSCGKRRLVRIISFLALIILHLPSALSAQPLEEAAELKRQISQLIKQGRYKESLPLAEKVHAIYERHETTLGPEHPDIAKSLTLLTILYKKLGDYKKAELLCKRSLAIWERILGPDHPDLAQIFGNLADLYTGLGDYQQAESIYKTVLAIEERALGPDHPDIAVSLCNLAELYRELGDYQKAEAFYKRALDIYDKTLSPNDSVIAKTLSNMAALYCDLGDYQKAEPLFKKAQAILEMVLGPSHPEVAAILNNQAELCRVLGDYKNAETLLKRSLTIWTKTLGPDHPDVGAGLDNLGFLYLDAGNLEEANSIFKKRNVPAGMGKYHLLNKDYSQATQMYLLSLEQGKKLEPHLLIGYYIGLGHAYEGQGNYRKAREQFQKAIELIEAQWKTLTPQGKKNFITGQAGAGFSRLEAYEGIVRSIFKERGKDSGKDSLAIAERVKGRVFLEMLAARQLRGKTKEDEAVLKKDREFQGVLLSLRKRIEIMAGLKTEKPLAEINTLVNELARREKEYTAFIEEVKLSGSELSSLLTVNPLSPSKLQSLLDPSTSLLEYFTTKEATYAWLITRDEIRVYEILINEKELQGKINAFLSLNLSNKARKTAPVLVYVPISVATDTTQQEREMNWQHSSQVYQKFYKDTIGFAEKDIKTKKLIIVPHGVLHKIPFSALSDGKNYLMEKYSLSILPSASVMEYVVKKRKPNADKILTLANPATDYVPLEFAEIEGSAISKLFPKSELCVKEKATETLSKKRSMDFNVIHFASHGQFNERQPLQSGLILARDDENDGFLQVHEIFGLDLKNANLVTLSACETALAKIQGGDDLVGLSRGFIYAGTPSLLATLWEVDDQSTSILMEHFYKNWLKGMSKPEALRQAQISLKQIPQYSHPFYWAPFVMIGDWQ